MKNLEYYSKDNTIEILKSRGFEFFEHNNGTTIYNRIDNEDICKAYVTETGTILENTKKYTFVCNGGYNRSINEINWFIKNRTA